MTKPTLSMRRDDLLYALDHAIIFTKKKGINPISTLFLFTPRAEGVTISSFDEQTLCEVSCQAEVKGDPASFMVDAVSVHKIVSLSMDEEVKVSFRTKEEKIIAVVFVIGRNKHSFPIDPGLFPDVPIFNASCSFTIPGADLRTIGGSITNMISNDEATSMGEGVNLKYTPEQKAMYFWCARGPAGPAGGFKCPMDEPAGFSSFTIPTKVFKHMDQLVAGNETVDVRYDGTACEIVAQNVYLRSRVSMNPYPDFYKIIRGCTDRDVVCYVSVGEMRMAMDKLSVHTDDDFHTVRLRFGDKQIEANVTHQPKNTEGDEVVPYMSAEKTADAERLLDIKFVQAVLRQTISDTAVISLISSKNNTPVFIESFKENKTITFLVMPFGRE